LNLLYNNLIPETLVTEGNLITRLSTEWSWSLDYRIFDSINSWGQVLFCDGNNDVAGWGFRTPAMSVQPGSKYRLIIGSAVDGNDNYMVDFGEPTDFNKTNHLEIHQRYVSNGDYMVKKYIHKSIRLPHSFTMSSVRLV